MTSLGILGTFSGIVVGLMAFDPSHIDDSISLLLAGLKTAFLTSLVGMCATIVFKVISPFLQKKDIQPIGIGPVEIYAVMSKQLTTMNMLAEAIGGNEDSSLASQIRLIRIDMNDANKLLNAEMMTLNAHNDHMATSLVEMQTAHGKFSDRLWVNMAEFGEMLSKSATEQVINALKEVILDFNNKLSEQFGDNFKRLDQSVKKLLDWQDNYRQQLEDMAHKYQQGVDAITLTEKAVVTISERAEAIPITMEKLHVVMELGQGQVQELEQRLNAFKDLRDKAIDAMPQIKQQLDDTMSIIGNSVIAASSHYQTLLVESTEMMGTFTEGHRVANTEFTRVTTAQLHSMNETATNMGSILMSSSEDIRNNMRVANENILNIATEIGVQSDTIAEQLRLTVTEVNEQVSDLATTLKDKSTQTAEILVKSNQALIENTGKVQQEVIDNINALQHRLGNVLEDVFQAQVREVKRTFESLENQVQESVALTGKGVEKQVHILDKQMQEEVNRVVNEMGQGLATVTQQFTRDYTQLTQEMAKVLNSVNRVPD